MNLKIHFKKLLTGVFAASIVLSATGCGCMTTTSGPVVVQTAVIRPTTYMPTSVIYESTLTPDKYIDASLPEGLTPPTLSASNLSAPAGSSIDYLGNLVIEGDDDTEITEIYVDTSNVRPSVPGVYNATYTINFRGYPISKTIVVTITPPTEDVETPTFATTLPGTPIADMPVTLLSGRQCLVPCTTEHYILETTTEESTETILGKQYRKSVLIVHFNDGEIVELETARVRTAE